MKITTTTESTIIENLHASSTITGKRGNWNVHFYNKESKTGYNEIVPTKYEAMNLAKQHVESFPE
jgi:hypothetical protein